jgi:hypothetical protein
MVVQALQLMFLMTHPAVAVDNNPGNNMDMDNKRGIEEDKVCGKVDKTDMEEGDMANNKVAVVEVVDTEYSVHMISGFQRFWTVL